MAEPVTQSPPDEPPTLEPVPMLQAYLAQRDEPCPLCGYNVRGLTGRSCPECGSALVLRLGLAEPRMAAYITTVVAWSVGLGGSLLMSLIALAEAPLRWWVNGCAIILLVMLIISAIMLPVILLVRRRFRQLDPLAQVGLALASTLAIVILGGLFVITFDG